MGAMGRSPLYFANASSQLSGKSVSDTESLKEAAQTAADSAAAFAVHNVGSSLDYRCRMVAAMVKRALEKACGQTVQ